MRGMRSPLPIGMPGSFIARRREPAPGGNHFGAKRKARA